MFTLQKTFVLYECFRYTNGSTAKIFTLLLFRLKIHSHKKPVDYKVYRTFVDWKQPLSKQLSIYCFVCLKLIKLDDGWFNWFAAKINNRPFHRIFSYNISPVTPENATKTTFYLPSIFSKNSKIIELTLKNVLSIKPMFFNYKTIIGAGSGG